MGKRVRLWYGEVSRLILWLEDLGSGHKLHGEKWASKMAAHYGRLAQELLDDAPRGCKEDRRRFVLEVNEHLDPYHVTVT